MGVMREFLRDWKLICGFRSAEGCLSQHHARHIRETGPTHPSLSVR